MKNPILELKNIDLCVSNFTINQINLTLYPGEVHMIMGENGSGKSLLMELISGLVQPDSGEIWYDGKLMTQGFQTPASNEQLIFIQQYSILLENISVAENLYFHNLPYKNKFLKIIDYPKLNAQFRDLIKELDLPIKDTDKVEHLGLAQRQMIEFLKAYVSNSKVVILDEPSASLTSSERDLLYRIVNQIKKRGAGIFYITHRIDDAIQIGDRITLLNNGSLIGTKVIAETTEDEIINLLVGTHLKERYPKLNCKKGKELFSVSNLSYEDKLLDINFRLQEGEVFGITGLAGSGRSLLAKCLFGALNYQGQISIQGKPVRLKSPKDAIAHQIALLPEDRYEDSIFKYLNTMENVALPSLHRFSQNSIINSHFMNQSVLDYINKLNLPKGNRKNINSFSEGSLQKAIFAKWLMSLARIFILDEPTRGIDLASKIDIYNFINDLTKKKAAVIYISSDVEEIMGICDRVAILTDKSILCILKTSETSVQEITELQIRGNKENHTKE